MLVTRTRYNAKGEPFETVDPKGIVTRSEFDALGRRVRTIQNYLPGSTDPEANVTTEFTYNAGHLSAVTAINPATGNQTTRYEYGVSPATGSLVSRNDLLRETIYPDGGLDTVKNRYNRQGERIGMTDQNGTVHAYERDKLGRITADEVTSLGTGVDGAVRKLGTTYNARGLVEKLTSYGPTGSVVNEVKNTYNGLNQLTEQAQSHAGAVTGGTPKVEYGYDHSASGGVFTKGARPTDITYPSGRVIDFDYGSAGGAGDKLARIEALVDGAQTLVAYSYLGVGTFVVTDYVEPQVKLDYTAAASGDAKYPGFDQYNRVVQHHWTAYGASPGLRDGFDYGYDANSNRLWRANLTAQALDKPFDELYAYDRLNRLVDFQRGTLNSEHTAILGTPTKEQTWNLDPTGNWSQFTSADDGALETDQTRISNPANEITGISSWFPPDYDHAGNMIRIPKPAAPQEGFLATWDAWNRMVKLIDAGTSDTVQENAFDAQTWRTVRKDYEAGSLSETRHFFYTAQWQSIEERLGAATTPERQHVWGLRYIDDLILRDRDTDDDGDLDERLYAMQDANWNVTAITDDVGSVQERFVYEAYGKPQIRNAVFDLRLQSEVEWLILFAGRPSVETSGMLQLRHRDLHTALGAFLSPDPLWYMRHAPFEFASSNPITLVDPSGMLCFRYDDGAFDVRSCSPLGIVYSWPIEWKLSPEELNGFIFQRVYRLFLQIDCKRAGAIATRRFTELFKAGAPPEQHNQWDWFDVATFPERITPEWQGYWELWPVKNGKVYRGKPPAVAESARDVISLTADTKTCGYDIVLAEAFFLPTKIAGGADWPVPPKGWEGWVAFAEDFPAGDLAARPTPKPFIPLDPKKHGFASVLRRRLVSFWCCCDCAISFTQKVEEVGRCP